MRRLGFPFVLWFGLLLLAGCAEGYSPNTYASNAAQEEAAVQRGVIVGVRQVMISANGTVGIATGGAAGGVAGAQAAGGPVITALGAIGGTLVGGLGGNAAAHAVADTKGWEYIVEEDGGKLVSVTQTSKAALLVGLHVLVISGTQQARIVPDYTVQIAAAPPAPPSSPANTAAVSDGSTATEINLSLALPGASAAGPLQIDPTTEASDPATPPAPAPAATQPVATPMAPATLPAAVAAGDAVSNGHGATATAPSAPVKPATP